MRLILPEAAREAEADEDERKFDKDLARVAKHKPEHQDKAPAKKEGK